MDNFHDIYKWTMFMIFINGLYDIHQWYYIFRALAFRTIFVLCNDVLPGPECSCQFLHTGHHKFRKVGFYFKSLFQQINVIKNFPWSMHDLIWKSFLEGICPSFIPFATSTHGKIQPNGLSLPYQITMSWYHIYPLQCIFVG